jgi:hypothetical protein
VVRVAHADEPAAVQRRLPAAEITETNVADDSRVPDVQFVAVTEQIHVGEPDRLPALDAQLEDQPVRHVNKILVEHGHAAQDRRLAVVTAVYVGTRIMHAVGVFPLLAAFAVTDGGPAAPKVYPLHWFCMCPAEAPMATVPSAAAKPSWTISQPESVPPGCSGKFLLRSRAVHRADLPLRFFS